MRPPLFTCNSAPFAGEPFLPPPATPPSVNAEFFAQVCPNPTVIDREQVNGLLPGASAATLVQAWVDKLGQTEDRCVEIRHDVWPVFDLWCVLLRFLCSAGSDLLDGKGWLVIRLDCSMYGPPSLPRQY